MPLHMDRRKSLQEPGGRASASQTSGRGFDSLRARQPAQDCISGVQVSSQIGKKAHAHPLREALDAFLLTQQVAGCTSAKLKAYRWWLEQLASFTYEPTALTVHAFFARLQARGLSASRQHQAYRTLKTLFRWGVEARILAENPLRGFSMRTPKTLPTVSTEDELRAVLAARPDTPEGIRNRAFILVLAGR